MRQSPLRSLPRTGTPYATSRLNPCPRDVGCSCHHPQSRLIPLRNASTSAPCDDPIDHFTDYDHYERCCDGHHHGTRSKEECCVTTDATHCSPVEQCDDCFDDCDECADEHQDCYEAVDVRDDDCEQCEVECEEQGHEPEDCPRNHPTTRDNCTSSCELVHVPLPLLGPTNDFDSHAISHIIHEITPCTSECNIPIAPVPVMARDPLEGMVFDSAMDHWQTFVQAHHCAPDPCLIGQPPQFQHPQHVDPSFGFTFGCDPNIPGNQYPWQRQTPLCNVPLQPQIHPLDPSFIHRQQQQQQQQHQHQHYNQPFSTSTSSQSAPSPQPSEPHNTTQASTPTSTSTPTPTSVSAPPPTRTCEWVMPCNSICGATFPRTEDLKKHIKNSHSTKGTLTCRWKSCHATFATEAALTGHISKKHLTTADEEGPWKCTFPGCAKSFMYKQVRDDHVASHNGGNRMHCPICHQWLNCEGSNFRRHMASHGPKNEYMRCRFEGLGCKKRFSRLDNLRRHEACCKCGKRAAGVHHHHHRVHVGHI